jgi:hypothetical protein
MEKLSVLIGVYLRPEIEFSAFVLEAGRADCDRYLFKAADGIGQQSDQQRALGIAEAAPDGAGELSVAEVQPLL